MILCLLVKDFASQLLPLPYSYKDLEELYLSIYFAESISQKLKIELQRLADLGVEVYIR